jgi:hypothetical protein
MDDPVRRAGWKSAPLEQKLGQKIRVVWKQFLRFARELRAATCNISRETNIFRGRFSGLRNLEQRTGFPVDDFPIRVE